MIKLSIVNVLFNLTNVISKKKLIIQILIIVCYVCFFESEDSCCYFQSFKELYVKLMTLIIITQIYIPYVSTNFRFID